MKEKLIQQAAQVKNNYLDSAIRKKLKEKGFEFENNVDFVKFLKERCGLTQTTKGLCVFYLDKKPLFQWWDTFKWEHKPDESGEIKVFCTYGLPPEESGAVCERGYKMDKCMRREHSVVGCKHCSKPILN